MESGKINLKEIVEKEFPSIKNKWSPDDELFTIHPKDFLVVMKEAIRQALELAVEKADAGCDFGNMSMKRGDLYATFAGSIGNVVIDKQSILNVINLIE